MNVHYMAIVMNMKYMVDFRIGKSSLYAIEQFFEEFDKVYNIFWTTCDFPLKV